MGFLRTLIGFLSFRILFLFGFIVFFRIYRVMLRFVRFFSFRGSFSFRIYCIFQDLLGYVEVCEIFFLHGFFFFWDLLYFLGVCEIFCLCSFRIYFYFLQKIFSTNMCFSVFPIAVAGSMPCNDERRYLAVCVRAIVHLIVSFSTIAQCDNIDYACIAQRDSDVLSL